MSTSCLLHRNLSNLAVSLHLQGNLFKQSLKEEHVAFIGPFKTKHSFNK